MGWGLGDEEKPELVACLLLEQKGQEVEQLSEVGGAVTGS
jgi:hypothetical protein